MKSSYFNKNLLTNFKLLGYLCLTLLLFYGCDDEQLKPKEKEPAENLTFQKMTVPFSYDTINAVQILAKVQGKKRGYTLNEIKDITPKDVVTISEKGGYNSKYIKHIKPKDVAILNGKGPNFIITMNKIGNVTATIVLQHKDKKDATIAKATIEITKATPETLTFQKVTKVFSRGGSFSTADILAGVQGTKAGYTVKSITNISPNSLVTVSGTKSLNFSGGVGSFTATIVLEHPTKADATISGAKFEITKVTTQRLTFQKVTKVFSSGGSFSTADILAGVQGTKAGYTVKNITAINPNNLVTVSSKALNFKRSVGSFTATIVFEHNTKADATITGAQFEITKATAPVLTWTKQAKAFASGGEISNANLLAGLTGADKGGYEIKTVTITDASGTGASVSGSGTSSKITSYTKYANNNYCF